MRIAKKKFSYKSSRLTAEQESLLKQEKELRQREAFLKRRLQERPPQVLRTTFAGPMRMPEMFASPQERPRRGLQKKEKRAAKIKFVVLLVILTALLILIWRSLPSVG